MAGNNNANLVWSIANILRGTYKPAHPGGLHLTIRIGNGQALKTLVLLVYQEASTSVKGSSGFVERIPYTAAMHARAC